MKKILAGLMLVMFVGMAGAAAPAAAPKMKPKARTKRVVRAKAKPKTKVVEETGIFKDVPKSDPAYSYIVKMVSDYGVISGYPDGTFRGEKTITRAEFCKVMTSAMSYLEKQAGGPLAQQSATNEANFKDLPKNNWAYPYVAELVTKYKIFSGYPDGTFKPDKTINKFEITTVLSKALKMVYAGVDVPLPKLSMQEASAITFKDVPPSHWAMEDIRLLISQAIMAGTKEEVKTKKASVKAKKAKKGAREIRLPPVVATPEPAAILYNGKDDVTRNDVAIAGAKFIDKALQVIAMRKKKTFGPLSMPERYMGSGEKAFIAGDYGQLYESASTTNSWASFAGSALYGNIYNIRLFNLPHLSGDYELEGKAGYDQLFYFIPTGPKTIAGGTVNETSYNLALNTTYPIKDLYGFNGKLLLGLKYGGLSNTVAPTNYLGLDAGLATVISAFNRQFLTRGFYSYIPNSASKSGSILGVPSGLLDYETGTEMELFKTPVMIGYSGETMLLNGGFNRFYNMVFVRYYLK